MLTIILIACLARFVPLPGSDHLLLEHEPAWKIFLRELGAFLGRQPEESSGINPAVSTSAQ